MQKDENWSDLRQCVAAYNRYENNHDSLTTRLARSHSAIMKCTIDSGTVELGTHTLALNFQVAQHIWLATLHSSKITVYLALKIPKS